MAAPTRDDALDATDSFGETGRTIDSLNPIIDARYNQASLGERPAVLANG